MAGRMTELRRPGSPRAYVPTHAPSMFSGNGIQKSCGKCGVWGSIAGSRKDKRTGLSVGLCCAKGKT
jgi:hypothetical protein